MTISEQLEVSFGEGPEPPPLDPVLRAGRRRLVGRRLGVAVAAAVVVMTTGFALAAGGESTAREEPTASRPSASPPATSDPLPSEPDDRAEPTEEPPVDFEGQLAVVTFDGEVYVNPRATILERTQVRYDGQVAYLFEGRLGGRLLFQFSAGDGGMSAFDDEAPSRSGLRAWGAPILREYVEANRPGAEPPDVEPGIEVPPPAPPGLVSFRDGRLVPADGVTITDEVADVALRDFAEPGQPTAAARFTHDGAVYFLVARPGDVIAVEPPPGVDTLRQWVRFAQAAYEAGVGLL